MESDFLELMPQSITVATRASRSADGHVTFSTSATTYRARVVNSRAQVRDDSGVMRVARYEVWVNSTAILAPDSKFTLPDGSTPPILSVDVFPDETGNHHNRVMFGW